MDNTDTATCYFHIYPEVLILDPWEFYSNRFVLAVARFVSRLPHNFDSRSVVVFNKYYAICDFANIISQLTLTKIAQYLHIPSLKTQHARTK
jgi:hypothetical protein